MLTLPPWNRLPLTVHWLSGVVGSLQCLTFLDKYHGNLEGCCDLPQHMSSSIGPFEALEIYKENLQLESEDSESEYSASGL
jgi:hypothetical protein